jgi:hypothetical protein
MNRNVIQEIQNNMHSYEPKKTLKFSQKQLIEYGSSKFDKEIFQTVLGTNRHEKTSSKTKQTFGSFGQEEFIAKLKMNTTKQIDRKSAKAIQKYLQELNLKKVNRTACLSRARSLQCFSDVFSNFLPNNEESA